MILHLHILLVDMVITTQAIRVEHRLLRRLAAVMAVPLQVVRLRLREQHLRIQLLAVTELVGLSIHLIQLYRLEGRLLHRREELRQDQVAVEEYIRTLDLTIAN